MNKRTEGIRIYHYHKSILKKAAKDLKAITLDKPYIRQTLNDMHDEASRNMSYLAMKDKITVKQASLYSKYLDIYVCKLHPSD